MAVAIGFRFFPTEEELVSFYLRNQLQGTRQDMHLVIPVLNIFYDLEPWDLPKLAGELCKGDVEQWFYFIPRQEREARGGRASRTTASGYWKATGSPGFVYSSDDRVIGMKKTMVFYKGKAPNGRKTKWKMNEYRAIEALSDPYVAAPPKLRHDFSLCRVYVASSSSRAFDRRPLEAHNNAATTSGGASGTSHAGGDHYNPAEASEDEFWELVNNLEEHAIGWEQLNEI
ncbi:hypothetical protein PVK06_031232 [Gossypium arboreum]|uniref:NAC domain-containing protein n=2 Tax=Gossypium arboreum TaxID=29729 RepID=A0ABR0NR19_GOSAR|nr:hypothetical protein PVK06_031232 [Gossypium arboreum]